MLMLSEKGKLLKLTITEEELEHRSSNFYRINLIDKEDKVIGFCNFVTCSKDMLYNRYPSVWIYKIEVTELENRGQAYGKALLDATEYFASTELNVDRIEGKFYPDEGCRDAVKQFYERNDYRYFDLDDWGSTGICKDLTGKVIDKKTGEKIEKKQEIIQRVGAKITKQSKVKFVSLEEQKAEKEAKEAKTKQIKAIISDAEKEAKTEEKAETTKSNKDDLNL